MRRAAVRRGPKRIFQEVRQAGGARPRATRPCRGETVVIRGAGVVKCVARLPYQEDKGKRPRMTTAGRTVTKEIVHITIVTVALRSPTIRSWCILGFAKEEVHR